MKRPVCILAQERAHTDENWRRHAAGCQDCGEILKIREWMNVFAGKTAAPGGLPSAGLLLFKSRLNKRLSSAERAAGPINAMAFVALSVSAASMVGVAFGTESQFGSIMIEALGLFATYAFAIAGAVAAVAIICGSLAVILKRLEP